MLIFFRLELANYTHRRNPFVNVLTLIAASAFSVVLATFIVLLTLAIVFNVKAGRRYRKTLAKKIDTLRLSKMLAALGIDASVYLSTVPTVDINNHMERCTSCTNTEECDDKLRTGNIDTDGIGFCNNEDSLRELSKESGKVNKPCS